MTKTSSTPNTDKEPFSDRELERIEQANPDGLSLAQLLDIFSEKRIPISEATFRKYVQLGLLGRSRRVGRKGKHQGSMGLYPNTTVRRIHMIRQMMAAHYTIEDIQRSFLRFTNELELLEQHSYSLFDGFEKEISAGHFSAGTSKELSNELVAIRKTALLLFQRIARLERKIISPLERMARERAFITGTSLGAEDLL